MGNIINLIPQDNTPDEVLENCKGNYKDVLILGWDKEELLSAKATNSLDVKEMIYMIEVFKSALISSAYSIDE